MTPEPIEENPNPITEIRKKTDTALVIERTPKNPVTLTTTHNITELEAEIARYQAVIGVWQAKITPLQAIIDEYNEMP